MASSRRKGKTVAELEAEFRASEKYAAYAEAKRKKDEEHEQRVQENRRRLAPLLADLQKVGVPSLGAIAVGDGAKAPPFPSALPILLDHLQRPYDPEQRWVIAGALAIPQARVGWRILVTCYEREKDDRVRSELANTLNAAVDESVLDEYLGLLRNPANGSSRLMLLRALVRLKVPRGIAALREALSDPQLRLEAEAQLKKVDRKKH